LTKAASVRFNVVGSASRVSGGGWRFGRRTAPYIGDTLGLPVGVSVLVIRPPDRTGVLRCSDTVLTPQPPPPCSAVPAEPGTILPGERFADSGSGLEIVRTRAGQGILTFDGRPMQRCPEAGYRAAPWTDWKTTPCDRGSGRHGVPPGGRH
jgi:hypothetical protein